MAISHELSGEIAAAILSARDRSAAELDDLKQVVFQIHSTLEQLTREERVSRADRANARLAKTKSAGQES